MKKFFIASIFVMLLILPLTAIGDTQLLNNNTTKEQNIRNEDFTHTVFAEYGTMTTCPYCVAASSQLYSIYNSGDLDFDYVSLVWDEANVRVRNRLKEIGITNVPDVYFDGKFKNILGRQNDETPYRNAINQCGVRDVEDIDISVQVDWKGGGTLKITVTVINNEAEKYNGHLRTYVVEKESRWNDNSGNPYHYAAIDIPIDKGLSLSKEMPRFAGETYTFSKTWFGAIHGFSDIDIDNIVVIATVFDSDTDYAVESAMGQPTISNPNDRQVTNFLASFIFERLINKFLILQDLLLK